MAKRGRKAVPCPDYDRLRSLAAVDELRLKPIAAEFGATPKAARRWLREIGIEYRSGYRPTGTVGRYVKDTGSWRNGTGRRPKIYNTWIRMRHRCYSKACKDYRYYGGRGIRMCDEWRLDYDAFRSWSLRNGVRKDLTLDRIDNDGDYEPGNCRWISQSEQNHNKRPGRRTSVPLTGDSTRD